MKYYKRTESDENKAKVTIPNSFESRNSVETDLKEILSQSSKNVFDKIDPDPTLNQEDKKCEFKAECDINYPRKNEKTNYNLDSPNLSESKKAIKVKELNCYEGKSEISEISLGNKFDLLPNKEAAAGTSKESEKNLGNLVFFNENKSDRKGNVIEGKLEIENSENQQLTRGRKRKLCNTSIDNESASTTNTEDGDGNEENLDNDMHCNEEADQPRRRGRRKGKKSAEAIPPHLSSDMVLGYKMLVRFLETPQFSGFHKPFKRSTGAEDSNITCLNQIKKKFEDNSYKMVSEFVNDIREMLTNIYESRNPVAIKRALRLEQVLEQRIAQLPNYLRPQCALVLPPDEITNSHNKIRISKGGGFVSLLLEKTEKQRYEKNKEKRKLLAEERKQLKEEQNKDVQEWEKNVLLKDFEEEIKSMWELPAIGHFIHLCADILNIGEVAQFEVERMLLMPQCSDTLDLIMTALLTNSLMRAKLDRTPSMPYSIWGPLVRTRVVSWYRTWHKEGRNEQKLFEEIGIEREFWQILGPDINPLDYYYFHEISLLQRVWILKTLCDVDFVRKRTVHDNIRAQVLEELNPVYLGIDRHGNRYIQLKQFCSADVRIYRQSSTLEGDITMSEFVENFEGFERREGPITADKIFRDIWESADKPAAVKTRKKKSPKAKKQKNWNSVVPDSFEKKNLRRSARAKKKTYVVDWSDSDQSDTDLITLKKKLSRAGGTETLYKPFSEREFISLSVFRLPRDKVTKPSFRKSSHIKKAEESGGGKSNGTSGEKTIKVEPEDGKEEIKPSGCEDEQSDSLDAKQMQEIQSDFEKTFQGDDMNGDEFNLEEKLSNFKSMDKVKNDVKFTVKNLEDLKMVFKKGSMAEGGLEKIVKSEDGVSGKEIKSEENSNSMEKEYDSLYRYEAPDHLKPDGRKFYLVVDSVEGLRQLISKFGSHENDLEIITRSTKSRKKISQSNTSCEVELIERLQNLLEELEPWEIDFMKSHRANKEKMYKEYMNFINRPPDFVHPNESYWMKTYEEPAAAATSASAATGSSSGTTSTTTGVTAEGNAGNGEKGSGKETAGSAIESVDLNQQDNSSDCLVPRRRTRVTRLQLQPEENDEDDDSDEGGDYESNESDDNWVLPTSKKKSKKETTTSRTPKFPKRSVGRKSKSSPHEKTNSSTHGEKSHGQSPEKAKKALFWGPRSSDPSEDLNWEKNRQKILEKHNSPVKKVAFKSEEITGEMTELENALQKSEKGNASVITESPKRLTTLVPGNKKPYFSSAQLKAMENQAKQAKLEEIKKSSTPTMENQQTDSKSNPTPEFLVVDGGNKAPVKIQTYSRYNNAQAKQVRSPQVMNRPRQQVAVSVVGRMESTGSNFQQPVKFATQIRGPIQSPENSQKISSGGVIQQKVGSPVQIQIQQPGGQATQNRGIVTSMASATIQQPVQWQQKVITVQSVNQQGKVVQQQLQTQAQVPLRDEAQTPIQSQALGQGQVQQVIQVDPQTWSAVQQPIQVATEKLGSVQQVVAPQGQATSRTTNPDNDLYITDGKILIKFDNNFVQQYLTKEKVVALNVNEKLDVKKPLLIVKPKTDSNAGTSQVQGDQQPPTSQQNVLVFNKPATVSQETVLPSSVQSSVQSYVIPGNYVVKEENPVSSQSGQQTVKIVQQPQTYIIQQQKLPVGGKSPQPQIIKIITSQPMGGNQSLILSPASLSGGSQVIRPIAQAVLAAPDQQSKAATTLRFLRPHIVTSTPQGKISTVQNPMRVNSIVQIQSPEVETSKSQIITGRIVSTGVPTVRMTTPVQAQFLPSGNVTQSIRLSGQPLKVVATSSQSQVMHTSTLIPSSVTLNPQAVRPTTVNTAVVRLGASGQHQGVVVAAAGQNLQSSASSTGGNALPLRVVAGMQPSPTQAVVASSNLQTILATSEVAAQPSSAQPVYQVQSQTAVASSNLMQGNQSVRLVSAVGHSPPIGKVIASNIVGPRLMKNGTPGTVTVITSAAQSPGAATMGPAGIGGQQPQRLQTVLQSSGVSGDGELNSR